MEELYFLTAREARRLLLAKGEVRLNLDLRKTNRSWPIKVDGDEFVFPDGTRVSREIIERIAGGTGGRAFTSSGTAFTRRP